MDHRKALLKYIKMSLGKAYVMFYLMFVIENYSTRYADFYEKLLT